MHIYVQAAVYFTSKHAQCTSRSYDYFAILSLYDCAYAHAQLHNFIQLPWSP